MLDDIKKICKLWRGPKYIAGEIMTIGDVKVAPYMDRMCVLKHYRNFEVPLTKEYKT